MAKRMSLKHLAKNPKQLRKLDASYLAKEFSNKVGRNKVLHDLWRTTHDKDLLSQETRWLNRRNRVKFYSDKKRNMEGKLDSKGKNWKVIIYVDRQAKKVYKC